MIQETKQFPSRTYKVKVPENISKHAAYFTIAGDPDPKMFFFNSKAMESFQWIVTAMTNLSRLVEAGVPIEEIINDMKETFDPGGSYIIPDGTGRKVNSVVHHLGLILEQHTQLRA
jgi:hypothetical protein